MEVIIKMFTMELTLLVQMELQFTVIGMEWLSLLKLVQMGEKELLLNTIMDFILTLGTCSLVLELFKQGRQSKQVR